MDWDWEAKPTYESERIRIDASLSPLVFYDMKLPRQIDDQEVALMLSIADFRIDRGQPFLALVRHHRGTGVISARHRKAFADWLDERKDDLGRDDLAVVIVMPEAIFRAVLRVVYRFRTPLLRTITTPDVPGAADAIRIELARMGKPITEGIDAFLERLTTGAAPSSA
ncbi:MAG: hypothetical protein AMJ62_00300 [Myxococcales bacterium SG8_38]|nr:MAG: hypothetical protein AMJ62_00300 [Myxococcales bacterium SG8_38]